MSDLNSQQDSLHDFQHELDARGLLCPEPVMLLHNKVREMLGGEVLRVLATDPSTERDIPKFCTFLGHPLIHSLRQGEQKEVVYIYWIQKNRCE